MKRVLGIAALLTVVALPAFAGEDPRFDIPAYCKSKDTDKTAIRNCIDEEKSSREDVLGMQISKEVFKLCLDKAKKDPSQANYYSFQTCAQENAK